MVKSNQIMWIKIHEVNAELCRQKQMPAIIRISSTGIADISSYECATSCRTARDPDCAKWMPPPSIIRQSSTSSQVLDPGLPSVFLRTFSESELVQIPEPSQNLINLAQVTLHRAPNTSRRNVRRNVEERLLNFLQKSFFLQNILVIASIMNSLLV